MSETWIESKRGSVVGVLALGVLALAAATSAAMGGDKTPPKAPESKWAVGESGRGTVVGNSPTAQSICVRNDGPSEVVLVLRDRSGNQIGPAMPLAKGSEANVGVGKGDTLGSADGDGVPGGAGGIWYNR